MDEITRFINVWEQESAKTVDLLKSLPHNQYDFRPDADGRSLGELAWHLAEGDAYITHGIWNKAATAAVNASNNSGPVYGNNTSGTSVGIHLETWF